MGDSYGYDSKFHDGYAFFWPANSDNADRLSHLLNKAGIWEQREQKPAELSGGECQRTAVVRSLINKPKLILADEPTGALDEENAQKISGLLISLGEEQNTSLIIVTHSRLLSEQLEKSYTFKNGMLV